MKHTALIVPLSFCVLLSGAPCGAQNYPLGYPLKPVRTIIPAGAGTPTDLIGRAMGQSIAPLLGQPFVIENRVGANGIIGMEACAKGSSDGYLLCLVANAQLAINPYIYARLPYDPVKDYDPIIQTGIINAALSVTAALPVQSVRELVELSKAKPGVLNWSSWGVGSPSHLALAWLESQTGARFTHVAYKEPSQAWVAVQTGEASAIINPTGLTAGMVRAGKLRALAVSGTQRSPFLPDVPTFLEQGLDYRYRGWNGLLAPAGTPREILRRLNTEVNRLLAHRAFADGALLPLGVEPVGGSSEEFAAFIRSEMNLGEEIVKLARLKSE